MLAATVIAYAALVFITYTNAQGYLREDMLMVHYRAQVACRAGLDTFERKIAGFGAIKRMHKRRDCVPTQQNKDFNLWREDLDAAASGAASCKA